MRTSSPDREEEVSLKDATEFAFTAAIVAGQAGAPLELLDVMLDTARKLTRLANGEPEPAPQPEPA